MGEAEKHGSQLVAQGAHGPKEALERLFHTVKSPDMRDEAVGLDCPAKAGRRRPLHFS